MDLLDDAIKDKKADSVQLDINAFQKALCHADSQMKAYPATAQVLLLLLIFGLRFFTGSLVRLVAIDPYGCFEAVMPRFFCEYS